MAFLHMWGLIFPIYLVNILHHHHGHQSCTSHILLATPTGHTNPIYSYKKTSRPMFLLICQSLCAHKISFVQHFSTTHLYLERRVWNMCKNIFGRNIYVCSKFSSVCSSHDLCARTALREHCSRPPNLMWLQLHYLTVYILLQDYLSSAYFRNYPTCTQFNVSKKSLTACIFTWRLNICSAKSHFGSTVRTLRF